MLIAIDGACRGPGTPECFSVGALFAQDEDGVCRSATVCEDNSTSQRGEMLAMVLALEFIKEQQAYGSIILTDSKYVAHTINKRWYDSWISNDWFTASGMPVKNKHLWIKIVSLVDVLDDFGVAIFHVNGHVCSIGTVTARKILQEDTTGCSLREAVETKFAKDRAETKVLDAKETFKEINGIEVADDILDIMIIHNTVVDKIATIEADNIKENRQNG